MSGWWQTFKDVFLGFSEDEEPAPKKRASSDDFDEMFESRPPARISPLEKPSQIAICIPETPDEEWRPADFIKTDRPVIINFKKMDDEERDQVRNFMIGVIFALDGTFTKLSEDLFLFAPKDVGLITKHQGGDPSMESDFFSGELSPEDLFN
jgi:FtsZ-interacting cell division protein YlmF